MGFSHEASSDAKVKLILILLLLAVLGGLVYMFYYLEEKQGINLNPTELEEIELPATISGRIACNVAQDCPNERSCDPQTKLCT